MAALRHEQPFWLHANTHGLVDERSTNGYARITLSRRIAPRAGFSLEYGMDVLARRSAASTLHFDEAYVEARLSFLQVRLGPRREVEGTVDELLSAGSLATSANATPIPEVVASTAGYTNVPWTRGFVRFKGAWAHGWLRDDRFVSNPHLHRKNLYVKVGGRLPLNLYAGLVHNAFWGGTSSDPSIGRLPQGLDDYVRTAFAMSGGEDAPIGDRVYIQGNHLGVYDVGLTARLARFRVLAYRHFLYEDRDGLKLKNPQDGLFGLAIATATRRGLISRLVYEHLYTKRQSGPIPASLVRGGPGGRDNYYNHHIYRSGWTHYGRTIGSPLLFPVQTDEASSGIENNRVVGHHVGLAGSVHPRVRYRALATYTRNYGTYAGRDALNQPAGTYRFAPPLEQLSFLLEMRTTPFDHRNLGLLTAIALDVGELYEENVGVRVGLVYTGGALRP